MSSPRVYDDLNNTDLGEKIIHLQNRNEKLLQHIQSLEGDVARLCGELTQMKVNEDNLKKNISELFNTAKLEIQRKERMIADLQRRLDDLIFKRKIAKSFNRVNNFQNVDDTNKRSRDDVLSESSVNKKQKYESTDNKPKAVLNRGESSEKESSRSTSKSPARWEDIDIYLINKRIEAVRKCDDNEHQQNRRSRGYDRSRSREYSRSNSKERSQNRSNVSHRSKIKEEHRSRSKEWNQSRSKDREQSRSQNGHQTKSKKRDRSRSKECLRNKSKERRRSKSKEHHRSKSKEYDQIPLINKNGYKLEGHSKSKERTVYKSRTRTTSIDAVKKETILNKHIDNHREHVNIKMETEKLSTENINIKAEVDDQKSSKKSGENTINIKTECNISFISQDFKQSEIKTIPQSTSNLSNEVINEIKSSGKSNCVGDIVDNYKNATEPSSSSKTTDNYSKSVSCKEESTCDTLNTENYQINSVSNNKNSNVINQNENNNTINDTHRQVDSKVSQTSIKTEVKLETSESSIEEKAKCTLPVSKINNNRTIINARRRRCVIKIVN